MDLSGLPGPITGAQRAQRTRRSDLRRRHRHRHRGPAHRRQAQANRRKSHQSEVREGRRAISRRRESRRKARGPTRSRWWSPGCPSSRSAAASRGGPSSSPELTATQPTPRLVPRVNGNFIRVFVHASPWERSPPFWRLAGAADSTPQPLIQAYPAAESVPRKGFGYRSPTPVENGSCPREVSPISLCPCHLGTGGGASRR